MEDFISEILRRGEIQSEREHDIVFEEWKRIFYSDARQEEIMSMQSLLTDCEDKHIRG